LGYKHLDEAKAKMRKARMSEARFGEKHHFFGKKHTEEHIAKIRASVIAHLLGRSPSEETRKKNVRIFGYIS
jgi:hypothetical protein